MGGILSFFTYGKVGISSIFQTFTSSIKLKLDQRTWTTHKLTTMFYHGHCMKDMSDIFNLKALFLNR